MEQQYDDNWIDLYFDYSCELHSKASLLRQPNRSDVAFAQTNLHELQIKGDRLLDWQGAM